MLQIWSVPPHGPPFHASSSPIPGIRIRSIPVQLNLSLNVHISKRETPTVPQEAHRKLNPCIFNQSQGEVCP